MRLEKKVSINFLPFGRFQTLPTSGDSISKSDIDLLIGVDWMKEVDKVFCGLPRTWTTCSEYNDEPDESFNSKQKPVLVLTSDFKSSSSTN